MRFGSARAIWSGGGGLIGNGHPSKRSGLAGAVLLERALAEAGYSVVFSVGPGAWLEELAGS